MVRRLGEVLQTIGGYGFHIYDDWRGIASPAQAFAATKGLSNIQESIMKIACESAWLAFSRSRLETCNYRCGGKGRCKQFVIKSPR